MKKIFLFYLLAQLFIPVIAQTGSYNLYVKQKNNSADYFLPIDSVQNIVFQNYSGILLVNKKNNPTPVSIQTDFIKDITFLKNTSVSMVITGYNSANSFSILLDSIETVITQRIVGNSISGLLIYANASATGLSNAKVYLYNGTAVFDSTFTDANGAFVFNAKPNGNYTLSASCNKTWGGVNSTDALLIRKYLAGTSSLDSLQAKSADANGSSSINSTDALLIRRRVTGIDSTFKIGDWVFDNPAVVVNNLNITQNIRSLCTGDVNGSNVPVLLEKTGSIALLQKGKTECDKYKSILLPVTSGKNINISALTLEFHYPNDFFSILEIENKFDGLIYTAKNGIIRIGWDSIKPVYIKEGEQVLTIKVKSLTEETRPVVITLDPKSEIADENGTVIENLILTIPAVSTETIKDFRLEQNYPNPFNPVTNITFSLPKNSSVILQVFNNLGQMVRELIHKEQQAGTHEVQFDASQLTSGVYFYTIKAKATDGAGEFSATRKLILIK